MLEKIKNVKNEEEKEIIEKFDSDTWGKKHAIP